MTLYLCILAGIWTAIGFVFMCLGLAWTAHLIGVEKENKFSRAERFIKTKEELVEAYKNEPKVY